MNIRGRYGETYPCHLLASISHIFLHYFQKNFPFPYYFPVISHLFHSYLSFLNNFSLISQIFPNYFSFPDDTSHFSVTLPNYFSVISQLFPSESPDISAIASWSCSCSTRTDSGCYGRSRVFISVCPRWEAL